MPVNSGHINARLAHLAATAARGAPVCAVVFERLGPNVWHRSPAQAQFATPCRLLSATW